MEDGDPDTRLAPPSPALSVSDEPPVVVIQNLFIEEPVRARVNRVKRVKFNSGPASPFLRRLRSLAALSPAASFGGIPDYLNFSKKKPL